jgi:hypothetical protein
MHSRTAAEGGGNMTVSSGVHRTTFKSHFLFHVVLFVLIILVVVVLLLLLTMVVMTTWRFPAVCVVILRRVAVPGRKLAVLLSLVLSLLHPLPLGSPLFFQLPLLPLFDLVRPNHRLGGSSKNPLVFAEVAYPHVFLLRWITLVLELLVPATRLGRC